MKVKIKILICTGLMLNDHSNPYIESTTVLSDRARGLEENGAGPSGGGEGKHGIFNHKSRGQIRWTFRAWGSGSDRIFGTHTPRAVGVRGRCASVHLAAIVARFMPD